MRSVDLAPATVSSLLRLGIVAGLALAWAAPGRAETVVVPGTDSGHWATLGGDQIATHHTNVKTVLSGWWTDGGAIHHEIHGFLVFDLRAVPWDAVLASATIRWANEGGLDYNSPDPTELLVLHEVETDPEQVSASVLSYPAVATIGWPIYLDLADGPVLGSYLASPLDNLSVSVVPLDPVGVDAVAAAAGSLMAVGLRVDSLDRVEGVIEIFPAGAPVLASVFEMELELLPVCDDGVDNDGDGLVDLADTGCDDAADTSELPTEPDVTVTPASLDFGSVQVGTVATLDLQVRNDGLADLLLVAVTSSRPFRFVPQTTSIVVASSAAVGVLLLIVASATRGRTRRWRAACLGAALWMALLQPPESEAGRRRGGGGGGGAGLPVTIPPGQTATIPIEFRPVLAIPYDATMTIETDDPDEPSVVVPLVGVGF